MTDLITRDVLLRDTVDVVVDNDYTLLDVTAIYYPGQRCLRIEYALDSHAAARVQALQCNTRDAAARMARVLCSTVELSRVARDLLSISKAAERCDNRFDRLKAEETHRNEV